MGLNERISELNNIMADADPTERALVDRLIGEIAFFEEQMTELKRMPFIVCNPKNPAQIKSTAAAKLYKEFSAGYMNAVRILLNILRKVESTAQDELLNRLEAFTL